MKAGSARAAWTVIAAVLGILIGGAGSPAAAQTTDAACLADSLYLVSPDLIDLRAQNTGRQGIIVSWPDLDLAEATCYAMTASAGADFEAEVTGGYGGLVDRSFVFSTASEGGVIGSAQSDPLIYSWRSDGPSFYGSVGGTLNLANNGGIWRYDQAAGSWGQMNVGLPMTWPQTNVRAMAEATDGTILAGISKGATVSTLPAGLWKFSGGTWSRLGEDLFDSGVGITKVAFQPGNSDRFVVGTATDGPYLTTDGGATFVSLLDRLPQDVETMPTVYPVSSLLWTEARLLVFIPFYGLFASEDAGATFSRSEIQVVQDLDAPRSRVAEGGVLGGETVRMRGTVDLALTADDQRAEPELEDYERTLSLDLIWEFHAAPRTAGEDVQTFDVRLMTLGGQLLGDEEFELFRISADDSLGVDNTGQMTFTRQPDGKFRVEGYFDVYYQVEITGAERSPFQEVDGTSTGTVRFTLGQDVVCDVADNGIGTIDLPPQCEAGFVATIDLASGFPAGLTMSAETRLYDFIETMQLALVNDLREDPNDPDHLVAAVSYHGIMESDDGAYTWHPLRGDLIQPSTEIEGAWVYDGLSAMIDPFDSDTIVLGARQKGLYRTTDDGRTWTEVAGAALSGTVQPSNLASLLNISLAADPGTPGLMYAQEDRWSLLVSTDHGATWDHFPDQPTLAKGQVLALAADGSGDLMYGSWGGGIYVPDTPLEMTATYNSTTDPALRTALDLGLYVSFTDGAVSTADTLYLKCQTFQGWAVWRARGDERDDLTLLGLYDRVNPESCIEGYCGDESYELVPQCFVSKRAACFNFDTPDTVRFFDDEVYNGFEYYYAVTSFDYGSTALTTPQNNSKAMVFSPRWTDDAQSPFPGDGNAVVYELNVEAAAAAGGEEIYVFPNPLRPREGFPGQEGGAVKFTNLPPESRILVFTVAGDKVIELGPDVQQGGNIPWDCRNEKGEELAGGVFLYKVIMPERDEFWGKLVIIR